MRVSENLHTARFLCTTDADNNQIASFYAGAMNEARHIDLAGILRSDHDVEIALICPDDPEAMLRHTRACRDAGVPFAADPSQQIARMPGTDLREVVDGGDIDTAMVLGCGHPMGPLRLSDLIGLDTVKAIAGSMHEEFSEPLYAAPPLLLRMVDAGLLGQKAGRGFYDYTQPAR